VLPERVAGPLVTEYVTAPLEAEVADTVKGALPYVCAGMSYFGKRLVLAVSMGVS
jgi:hypothetical protein